LGLRHVVQHSVESMESVMLSNILRGGGAWKVWGSSFVPTFTFVANSHLFSISLQAPKAHGTSNVPVQQNLRWDCDRETADRICNFNRHYAEHSGYFETKSKFLEDGRTQTEIKFYDSNTGKLLFTAPKGRTMEDFMLESRAHGWPSFRDEEVNWDYVRCLEDGETVSVDGTHLGHNLADRKGNRYCINLVSVAGNPTAESK
jgi:peptide methionine sulfoxide reductase MsrB